MCGICGFIQASPVADNTLESMTDAIVHRGPDGMGAFVAGQAHLGMRRLSIIDVAGSDQPLYNEDKSIAVVFNGEIFNFRDLRQQLIAKGHTFHTDGDGEIIAHLYEEYGDDAPQHLRGQFAFALWDSNEQRLLLARDRMGQKPLYYYYDDEVIVFGSEIKALLQHPRVPVESVFTQNSSRLALYLSYGYMPAPLTAFHKIHALLPAHRLVWHHQQVKVTPYWNLPTIAGHHDDIPFDTALAQVRELLDEAVRLRLISDVPLGAFLSGGLDSSLVVAMMRQHSNATVKTFSIGFAGDASFDETQYAQQVADILETEHTAFTVEAQAMDLLSELVWHHDQPFADTSAIPTYLVSKLTKEHVTVALTGDGGDELFAGYDRFYASELARQLRIVPSVIWQGIHSSLGLWPEGTGYSPFIKRARRFANGASLPASHAYFDWVRVFNKSQLRDLLHTRDDKAQTYFGIYAPKNATLSDILSANMASYLPDDLLVKADRCSMQASLEARAPFLDHHLVEYSATLPLQYKLNGRISKYILKEVARQYLPDSIIDRKKHGFGAPVGTWLRNDIRLVREKIQDAPSSLMELLDKSTLMSMVDAHEQGKRDYGRQLWTMLTLIEWQRLFIEEQPTIISK